MLFDKAVINKHCVKSVRIQSFFGPYFPAIVFDTDQKSSEYGHFLQSVKSLQFMSNQF